MIRSSEPQDATPLIEFTSVSKWYGPVIAVNDVTLRLEPGITGLVGPNGAGKSTVMKLLTGQLRPSLGRVRIGGVSAWSAAAKSHVGYCPDVDSFYEEMSGRRFVFTMARLHGFKRQAARNRTEQVLRQVGMIDRADRPLGAYSKGMRQRIKLAQALVHDPGLVVLDEPLNGVDPVGRVELVDLFRRLARGGKAILISSHILDEMDQLADRVLFLFRGHILASGSLDQIRDMLDDHPLHVRITVDKVRELAARLIRLPCVGGADLRGPDELVLQIHRPSEFFGSFAEIVMEGGFEVERLQVIDASAEAIFEYLSQRAMHP
jgi:ABC-2 type transport system ATP-binding protein